MKTFDTAPLHEAASRGNTKEVIALLDAGTDPNTRASMDLFLLLHRIDYTSGPEDIVALSENEFTPLHVVAFGGYATTVVALCDTGADPAARNSPDTRPTRSGMLILAGQRHRRGHCHVHPRHRHSSHRSTWRIV